MRAIGRNAFAVVAGVAIGFLSTAVVTMRMLAAGDSAGAAIAVLVVGPVLFVEVTAAAVVTLVLLANERRAAAFAVVATFALIVLGEYVWLSP